MMNKQALSILISIILTAIIVSTVNVGTSLFLNEPEYNDFCDYSKQTLDYEIGENITKEICEANEGVWEYSGVVCKGSDCPAGYCDFYKKCQSEYDAARREYNQNRFYVFASLGFILLLVGLFAIETLIQITGLATGGILVLEGILMNLENKLVVFISLVAILVIFGILAWRVINKPDKKKK